MGEGGPSKGTGAEERERGWLDCEEWAGGNMRRDKGLGVQEGQQEGERGSVLGSTHRSFQIDYSK